MKRGGYTVEIDGGYQRAVSRSKLAVERNTTLLEVTVPIGVIRSLARVRPLNARACARGSVAALEAPAPRRVLRRVELALAAAIGCVLAVSVAVVVI